MAGRQVTLAEAGLAEAQLLGDALSTWGTLPGHQLP